MILHLILFFLSTLRYGSLFLFLQHLIVYFMLTECFFETSCGYLVNKISFVFESLFLQSQFLRLDFLLIALLKLLVEGFGLLHFFESFGMLDKLRLPFFTLFRNFLKRCLVPLKLLLGKPLLHFFVNLLLLLDLLNIFLECFHAPLIFKLFPH